MSMLKKIVVVVVVIFACNQLVLSQTDHYKLIIFEGSDWCANCIRFEKTIGSSQLFQSFIEEQNITIEHIDFPQRKKLEANIVEYNAKIAEKYQFDGTFPTILMAHTFSNNYEKISYNNQDPELFIALLKQKMSGSE